MMTDLKKPTTTGHHIFNADLLRASTNDTVKDALRLSVTNDGWITFELTIFTENAPMARELADAINDVLAKHQRLEGGEVPEQVAA